MAKSKWELKGFEIDFHETSLKEFKQILAEITDILYRGPASSKDCPNSTESNQKTHSESCVERIRTDG